MRNLELAAEDAKPQRQQNKCNLAAVPSFSHLASQSRQNSKTQMRSLLQKLKTSDELLPAS
jgi:hypothetical protein